MEDGTVAIACGVVFMAYFVRGVAGFGSGLLAVPLLALMYPVVLVVPVVVLLDYLGSAAQGLKHRARVAWPELIPLIIPTLIGIACALFLASSLDASVLSRALGVFVVGFAIYQLLPVPPLVGSRISAIPYGLLGGLVGTLFGTGGPLYVMYLNLRELSKTTFRASFAIYFLIDGTARLLGYTSFGFFELESALLLLPLLPVAAIGLFIGGKLNTSLSEATFKRLISVMLLLAGTALIFR